MTASNPDWDWRFTDPAEQAYETLQPHKQEREYLEPLVGNR